MNIVPCPNNLNLYQEHYFLKQYNVNRGFACTYTSTLCIVSIGKRRLVASGYGVLCIKLRAVRSRTFLNILSLAGVYRSFKKLRGWRSSLQHSPASDEARPFEGGPKNAIFRLIASFNPPLK